MGTLNVWSILIWTTAIKKVLWWRNPTYRCPLMGTPDVRGYSYGETQCRINMRFDLHHRIIMRCGSPLWHKHKMWTSIRQKHDVDLHYNTNIGTSIISQPWYLDPHPSQQIYEMRIFIIKWHEVWSSLIAQTWHMDLHHHNKHEIWASIIALTWDMDRNHSKNMRSWPLS